jgi:hypothetical protein
MCLRIRWEAMKLNILYPFLCFLFIFISIYLSYFSIFKDHQAIKSIFVSIGNILSFIPYLILAKSSRRSFFKSSKSIKKKITNKDTMKQKKYKSLKINYEYNDELEDITKIKMYKLIFISVVEYIQNFLLFYGYVKFPSNNNIFLWNIDILSIHFLSKCFLSSSIHRHHILCLVIFSFMDIYISIIVITSPNFNYWQILFLICNNFLYSFKLVYNRTLMEYNFISPYKLCYTIGLINLIMSIFTLIIFTYFDEKYDIPERYQVYIDNFFKYLSKVSNESLPSRIKEIFFSFFYILAVGLNNMFLYLTIICLSPYHYLMTKVLLSIGVNIAFMIMFKNSITYFTIITLCIYAFSLFILFIFLEVIELNFCNLNKNTKEQITARTLDKSNTFIAKKTNEFGDDININNSNNSINDSSSASYFSNENNNKSNLNNNTNSSDTSK